MAYLPEYKVSKRGRKPGFRMTEHHRSKIANSKILSFLVETALGKREMSKTQAFVAMGLIRKTLPDLSTTTLEGSADNPLQHRVTVAWERVDTKKE